MVLENFCQLTMSKVDIASYFFTLGKTAKRRVKRAVNATLDPSEYDRVFREQVQAEHDLKSCSHKHFVKIIYS